MSNITEGNPQITSDPYDRVEKIDYKRIGMLPYTSNRGMKIMKLKNNLFAASGQAVFG